MLRIYRIVLYVILLSCVNACCGGEGDDDPGSHYQPTIANYIALIDTNDKIIQILFENSAKQLKINSRNAPLLLSVSKPETKMFIQTNHTWDTLIIGSPKVLEYSNKCGDNKIILKDGLFIQYSSFNKASIIHYQTSYSIYGDTVYVKLK